MTFSSDQALNTNQLPISLDVNSDEQNYDEILQLYLRRIANATNTKISGLFLLQENAPFGQWFNSVPQVSSSQQNLRNSYRLTVDLLALYVSQNPPATTIPASMTVTVTLSPTTIPTSISGYMFPVNGYGGALDSSGFSYFPSDPYVFIKFQASTQTFTIVNSSINPLVQLYFVIEYLKN